MDEIVSNQTIQLAIERLSYGPDAIAHLPNGKTVFVRGGCPGDEVLVRITSQKKSYMNAVIHEIVSPGEGRVSSPCPYSEKCGGCPWQHLSRDSQLTEKRKLVIDALVRIARLDESLVNELVKDTLAPSEAWAYRNKVEFELSTQNRLELGLHDLSGAFLPINKCLLLPSHLADIPHALRGALSYAQGTADLGLQRVGIRYSHATNDLELALWTRTGAFPRSRFTKTISEAIPSASLVRVLLKGAQKARKVSGVEVLKGRGFWREQLAHNTLAISAPSFFQVNTKGAETLISQACTGINEQETSRAFDLYSGAGTFTLPLAKRFEQVIAIESYGSSVRDLKRNLSENDCANTTVIGGDVARELPALGNADFAIIDPPRAGLAHEVIDSLCISGVKQLVYVSCDPSTLARDLALLCKEVFKPVSITPVDLFPQSFHVETLTVLRRV